MNAGKSTVLLQSSYNYRERGMQPLLFTAAVDNRYDVGKITSRIGLNEEALIYQTTDNLYAMVDQVRQNRAVDCVFIDEAQFMTHEQVFQASEIVDEMNIPVLAYGLRTDFQGNLFPGSEKLLAWADNLQELKTICHCGKKANMVIRLDQDGEPVRDGAQVEIGGNDRYLSLCRKHFKDAVYHGKTSEEYKQQPLFKDR